MTGKDLIYDLIDGLIRARDVIQVNEIDFELVSDIDSDLEKYYDYEDSITEVLSDIEVED